MRADIDRCVATPSSRGGTVVRPGSAGVVHGGKTQPQTSLERQGVGPPQRDLLAISSIITVAFAGSVLVTPLYSLYQHKFGFSEITLTLVYAVYAVGNVVAL